MSYPNLSRTRHALRAFDAKPYDVTDANGLGRAVGVAYGLDTSDRNDPQTCAACIRPGKPPSADHPDKSLVRFMVRKWEAQIDHA